MSIESVQSMSLWSDNTRQLAFRLLAIGAIAIALTVVSEAFFTANNMLNILRQASLLFLLSSGLTLVILTGGLDLSVGANIALSGCLAGSVIEALGAANRKALVVGLNGDPEGIAAIKSGQMLATAAYDGFLMGCLGVMSAIRHLQRQPVPKEIVLGTPIIDKTSYQPYDVPLDQRQCPDWDKVVTSAAGK